MAGLVRFHRPDAVTPEQKALRRLRRSVSGGHWVTSGNGKRVYVYGDPASSAMTHQFAKDMGVGDVGTQTMMRGYLGRHLTTDKDIAHSAALGLAYQKNGLPEGQAFAKAVSQKSIETAQDHAASGDLESHHALKHVSTGGADLQPKPTQTTPDHFVQRSNDKLLKQMEKIVQHEKDQATLENVAKRLQQANVRVPGGNPTSQQMFLRDVIRSSGGRIQADQDGLLSLGEQSTPFKQEANKRPTLLSTIQARFDDGEVATFNGQEWMTANEELREDLNKNFIDMEAVPADFLDPVFYWVQQAILKYGGIIVRYQPM